MLVVRARRLIRRMRGGSWAHLIEAEDGGCYVVKFTNNPLGIRVLINECICAFLLEEMGISAPKIACVEIDEDFLAAHPDLSAGATGATVIPVAPGRHFGSRYPGSVGAVAIYDFLPDAMFHRLYNRAHFLGALVFDKWTCNGDGRQAIFFRARVGADAPNSQPQWVAQLIDNGHAFQGAEWTFRDSPVQGVYPRPAIYGRHLSMLKLWPWIEMIRGLKTEIFEGLLRALPAVWVAGQQEALQGLLAQLCERRSALPELVGEWIAWMRRSRSRSGPASAIDDLVRMRAAGPRPPGESSRTARTHLIS